MKCRHCLRDLPETAYYPSCLKKNNKIRDNKICIECSYKYRNGQTKNVNHILRNIYNHQRHTKIAVEYSFEEMSNWLMTKTRFPELYRAWAEESYVKPLLPSVIRKDFTKSYRLDNLEVLRFQDVTTRCTKGVSKPVVQIDVTGRVIAKFPNAHVAGKLLGLRYYNIHSVCKGKRPLCGGFKWRYDKKEISYALSV